MKWSTHTALLTALNLALLAGVGYLIYRLRAPDSPAPAVAVTEPGLTVQPAVPVEPPSATAPAPDTNRLHWAQLESEDYRTYIARLRAIGCPEQTIRDLIIADLDKLMAPRVQATVPYRKDLRYWQPEEEELWNSHDPREWVRQQRELDFEKREVVRELLGVDLVGERLKQQGREDYLSRRLGFLADDKRAQVRTILDQYSDQELALREKEWEEGEALTPEDRARLRQLREARQAELAQVLSPAELQQYDLWLGYSASKVREATYGMDATEDEFLKIYRLRKPFDDQWNADDADSNPALQGRRQQAQEELETQIRQTLGEPRYAFYQRAQDADFRALNAVAARYKLPPNTAADLYAYKKLVQQTRESVTANPDLTPEQQEQALQDIGDETERTIKEALGEKAYRYLARRGNAQWIKAPGNSR
jgi:hypothetical protein